jgi:Baseplate J-like protein
MSFPTTFASLIASATRDQLLAKAIGIMQTLGVDTESWLPGDPTRGFLMAQTARQAEWEDPDTGFPAMIAGGLLGLASGAWLQQLTTYNYNTPPIAATYATTEMTITNSTAVDYGSFDIDDMTVADLATGATFRNAVAFDLGPNATLTGILFEADAAGSASNADAGDITELVSTLDGVTVINTTDAVGSDEEEDGPLTARAQTKFESTSPDGPKGAYTYALTTPSMQSDGSNQTNVTRVRPIEDNDYGQAVIFIAGDSGALLTADQVKGQATVEQWSEPLVVDALVVLATNVTIDITYTLYVYDSIGLTTDQIWAQVATFLANAFKLRPIGGDRLDGADEPGDIFVDWIRTQIVQAVSPYAFECTVTSPATNVPLDLSPYFGTPTPPSAEVAVIGVITPTITILPAKS